ncbi:MAG TPA: hypothetical protein VK989_05810 [Polyangia bacterium]|nr:hypothetical protein [Polyangia bacterium]
MSAALARKYAALVELRRRRDVGDAAAGGPALRTLATEFPGCLRELDALGLPELERRAAAAAANADEPWLSWIAGYHALMRGALAVRDPRAAAARDDVTALAAIAAAAAGADAAIAHVLDGAFDEAFVAAVLTPPGGRVGVVVLRALSARLGVAAPIIAATLFPTRRPSPYAL